MIPQFAVKENVNKQEFHELEEREEGSCPHGAFKKKHLEQGSKGAECCDEEKAKAKALKRFNSPNTQPNKINSKPTIVTDVVCSCGQIEWKKTKNKKKCMNTEAVTVWRCKKPFEKLDPQKVCCVKIGNKCTTYHHVDTGHMFWENNSCLDDKKGKRA